MTVWEQRKWHWEVGVNFLKLVHELTYNPKVQQTSYRIAANLEIFRSRAWLLQHRWPLLELDKILARWFSFPSYVIITIIILIIIIIINIAIVLT